MAVQTYKTQPRVMPSTRSLRLRRILGRVLTYAVLIGGAALVLAPLLWTFSTALKTTPQTLSYPPEWTPRPVMWSNFAEAMTAVPFHIYYGNSLLIAVLRVTGQLVSSSLVAYGFARLRFPGRNFLFIVVLSTIMIPFQVLLIPRFVLFRELNWLDTLLPLIVPSFFGGAFTIFLLRQYMLTIPNELDDAARIDGCGPFGIFWRIILPLSAPALGAAAVFEFLDSWDEFLTPLIYLNSEKNYTVELGLNAFRTQYFTEWNLFMAASLVAMVIPVTVFFIAQKYFISGVALTGGGGVKG
ncbi:MAG: carbohydrate ABC transporter permease [Chloroflexaceae bacterium]|jgi:multiple sugar transport system permease protein|nr:carbohydrate ABC transporter permease [Chloroflexaceae bacterium]